MSTSQVPSFPSLGYGCLCSLTLCWNQLVPHPPTPGNQGYYLKDKYIHIPELRECFLFHSKEAGPGRGRDRDVPRILEEDHARARQKPQPCVLSWVSLISVCC